MIVKLRNPLEIKHFSLQKMTGITNIFVRGDELLSLNSGFDAKHVEKHPVNVFLIPQSNAREERNCTVFMHMRAKNMPVTCFLI